MNWRAILIVLTSLLVATPTCMAEISASLVRPLGHKLEQRISSLAENPQEASELKALLPLRYSVVEDDQINAFAARTRNTIIVNRGILDLVDKDDELAFVLGHEIGHIIVGQMKKVELEKPQEEWAIQNEAMVDELLADITGVSLMHNSGFDSDAAVKFFRRLIQNRGTLGWIAVWLTDKSSLDDVHLVEETRLRIVSAVAEQLREEDEAKIAPAALLPRPLEQEPAVFLWLGKSLVTVELADGKKQTTELTDTLGLYSEEDFKIARTVEIEARKQLIRQFLTRRYRSDIKSVLNINLQGVEKQEFRISPTPHPTQKQD